MLSLIQQIPSTEIQKKSFQTKRELLEYKKTEAEKKCKLNPQTCSEYKKNKKKIKKLHHPQRPIKPYKPRLQDEIAHAQKLCSLDCKCKDRYNLCYVSCGGTIDTRKICIENCN